MLFSTQKGISYFLKEHFATKQYFISKIYQTNKILQLTLAEEYLLKRYLNYMSFHDFKYERFFILTELIIDANYFNINYE